MQQRFIGIDSFEPLVNVIERQFRVEQRHEVGKLRDQVQQYETDIVRRLAVDRRGILYQRSIGVDGSIITRRFTVQFYRG